MSVPAGNRHAGAHGAGSVGPFSRCAPAPCTSGSIPIRSAGWLFHLNQRRGFKSNRRADRKSADDEKGKIRLGVKRLQEEMRAKGARTFGEFLHLRRLEATDVNHIPSVRTPPPARDQARTPRGTATTSIPTGALLEDEFDAIVDAQAVHHRALLTDAARETLFDVIFHQRPLKPAKVGLCTLLHRNRRDSPAQGRTRCSSAAACWRRSMRCVSCARVRRRRP